MGNLSDAADILQRAKEQQASKPVALSTNPTQTETTLPVYNLATANGEIIVKMMDPATPKKGEEIITE